MLTAVIVEDMPNALHVLQDTLREHHPDIDIVGTATSVVEASKLLRTVTPDILFLDIMLGDGTGFDVLEIMPQLESKIIFVTASDAYAIRAFKFAAIDYVLKPYTETALAEAIAKAKKHLQPSAERLSILKETMKAPESIPNKISLHTLDKIIIVDLNDIVRCEADSNNTMFYTQDGKKIFVTKTLKYFSDMLSGYQFIRVHQSHLVNIDYIAAFIKTDGGYLQLKDNSTAPVSVRKKAEVIEALDRMHR